MIEEQFLNDIIRHPHEDAPRLIYADYLQENGEELRGKFTKLSVEVGLIASGMRELKGWEPKTKLDRILEKRRKLKPITYNKNKILYHSDKLHVWLNLNIYPWTRPESIRTIVFYTNKTKDDRVLVGESMPINYYRLEQLGKARKLNIPNVPDEEPIYLKGEYSESKTIELAKSIIESSDKFDIKNHNYIINRRLALEHGFRFIEDYKWVKETNNNTIVYFHNTLNNSTGMLTKDFNIPRLTLWKEFNDMEFNRYNDYQNLMIENSRQQEKEQLAQELGLEL